MFDILIQCVNAYNSLTGYSVTHATPIELMTPITSNYNKKLYEIYKEYVKHNGLFLQYVPKKYVTDELCILAAIENGLALQYADNQNKQSCILAVNQNPLALKYVLEQHKTYELCKHAVQQDIRAFEFVTNPSRILTNEEICISAVKYNGLLLKYIDNQTPEICTLAVQQNGFAIQYVKNIPSLLTYDICILAVKQNIYASMFIQNPSTTMAKEIRKLIEFEQHNNPEKYGLFDSL